MRDAKIVEHAVVYQKSGRYGGWPANYGMWAWEDEIVLVFTEGTFSNTPSGHKRDRSQPFVTMQGRSLDGGRTWTTESFVGKTPKGRGLSADEHMIPELQIGDPYDGENPPVPLTKAVNFTDPETVVMVARTTCQAVSGRVHSWFHVSKDRCRSWDGPYRFTGLDDSPLLAGRTDIVPVDSDRALFLLTTHKADGREGRVCCVETQDGGRSFRFLSWLGEKEPAGFEIMPSSVRFDNGRILTAVRAQGETDGAVLLYESLDDGATWRVLPPAVPSMGGRRSNPPAVVLLPSGRTAIVYGYRGGPVGIRARISDDGGRSWSEDIVLRRDGGDFDIGYPRAVPRSDGRIVAGYYYNTHTDGDRFIAASIWDAAAE